MLPELLLALERRGSEVFKDCKFILFASQTSTMLSPNVNARTLLLYRAEYCFSALQALSNAKVRQPMPAAALAEWHEPAPPARNLAANEMLCDGVLTRWTKVIPILALLV